MRINLEHVREAKRCPFNRRSLQVGAFLLHGILWPGPLEGSFVLLEYQGTFRCIIRGGVTFHPASNIPVHIPEIYASIYDADSTIAPSCGLMI